MLNINTSRLYNFRQALDTALTVNALLKQWVIVCAKFCWGENTFLVDILSHLFKIIMVHLITFILLLPLLVEKWPHIFSLVLLITPYSPEPKQQKLQPCSALGMRGKNRSLALALGQVAALIKHGPCAGIILHGST